MCGQGDRLLDEDFQEEFMEDIQGGGESLTMAGTTVASSAASTAQEGAPPVSLHDVPSNAMSLV
jgi:hypothetical protein